MFYVNRHALLSEQIIITSLVKEALTWNAALGLLNSGNHQVVLSERWI